MKVRNTNRLQRYKSEWCRLGHNDSCLDDERMCDKDGFDFGRRKQMSIDVDQIVDASRHPNVSIGIATGT
jgi:hypothetical protein